MMGTKERAFGPLPPVTLEDLVPPGHFYRLSRGPAAAVPLQVRDDPTAGVRSASWGVRRLRLPAAVHHVTAGSAGVVLPALPPLRVLAP
jgi:hypothetical protein